MKIVLDLNGPQGNAFVLMAIAQNLCSQLSIPKEPIIQEMRSGDYEHLLEVFEENFSEYVELIRGER